jgi:hypothetical protein
MERRMTPMQRILVAMADSIAPLPPPRSLPDRLLVIDPPLALERERLLRELDMSARAAGLRESPLERLRDMPPLELPEIKVYHPPKFKKQKFWNFGKSEAEHERLRAKRKAERKARKKNRSRR